MLISLLFATVLAATPEAAPPRLTCIAATVRASGRIAKRRVEVSSGDKAADRRALDYLGMLDLSKLVPTFERVAYSGYVVVAEPTPQAFELTFNEQHRFHDSCDAAFAARNAP
ncbi:hypothetical protein [Dokdonella koreensis]|uniref:Uncharacterized protein n=1 Tax=Dokdonella koreensis DS-123 TaxID=1300342 RepID=A0A160DY90_9GAMM|nr:hypothetical protein [Dokdonella koreensis]ANB19564.1 Hypothetical protein I596_3576 [Dokdonella koreensis DS-123]